jgi:hypothetical protein
VDTEQQSAVVIVGNDRFLDHLVPFLECFRHFNPRLPLILIPFDDGCAQVEQLAPIYHFEIYRGSFAAVDALAEEIFGKEPYLRNRMRKLIGFDLPLREFLYVDTDILVEQSLSAFFGHIQPGSLDLVYVAKARSTYRPDMLQALGLQTKERFSTGIFLSSKEVASVAEIHAFMAEEQHLFHRARVPHLFDQPLLNFFFHFTHRELRQAHALGIPAVYSGVYGDARIAVHPDGYATKKHGERVTLTHWAGPKKFRSLVPYPELLQPWVERAQQRLAHLPAFAAWAPAYLQRPTA